MPLVHDTIEVGSQVRYSKQWLEQVGALTCKPFLDLRGTVTELYHRGGKTVATVQWTGWRLHRAMLEKLTRVE